MNHRGAIDRFMVNDSLLTPQSPARSPSRGAADDPVAALLIGSSPAMAALRHLVRQIAPTSASVLLQGASGTGKEVVARALHAASGRRGPMVAVNCGAIPAELIESELFGHEKGSFTGAVAQRKGRFEQASGGTLFLDEIGDMPLAMQVRLLRVLEERQVERVGGTTPIAVDCRIICATHRDVPAAIAAGRFREDLWFRLAVLPLHTPPLVERTADIAELIGHLQGDAPHRPHFTAAAIDVLRAHDWPGNVRELRNLVDRAGILHPAESIDAAMARALLCTAPLGAVPRAEGGAVGPSVPPLSASGVDLRAMLTDVERQHVLAALSAAHGVVADAARLCGMGRTTFLDKMKRHAITRELAA